MTAGHRAYGPRRASALLRTAVHAAVLGLAVGGMLVLTALGQRAAVSQANVTRPPSAGSPAALLEQHDCWTKSAPRDMEGKLPGHVVVTVRGTARYAGGNLVGQALDQVFNAHDHGLTVHGFCR